MSVARKILWNTFAQIAGKVIISGLGIVVLSLVTNYLGKEETGPFGEYSGAFDYLAFFMIVADLGLFTVGVREMAKDEKKIPMIVGNILTVRTVVAVLMAAVAAVSAYFTFGHQEGSRIPIAAILVGISSILNLLTSTVSTVLQVNFKMQHNSFASVVGRIIQVSYLFFAIYYLYPHDIDQGFYHLLWAGILGNAVMLGITYFYSRKLTNIRYRVDKEFWKDVIVKSLPYGIALVLNTIYFRVGSLLVLLLRGTAENGVYNLPMKMLEAVGIIPLYFMNSVLPVLTKSIQKKEGNLSSIIQYSFDFLVMFGVPIVAGVLVLAHPIVSLISPDTFLSNPETGWVGSDMVLQVVIFALLFSFVNTLFGFVLVADNRQMKLLTRNIFGVILSLGLGVIFIPLYGILAAAGISVLTEFYILLASYIIAKRHLNFQISLKNTFKIFLSAFTMDVIILLFYGPLHGFLGDKSAIILVLIGGVTYVIMLFLTKTVTKEMLALLRKPKVEAKQDISVPEV